MEWASSNLDLFLLRQLGVVVFIFSHACILIVALTIMALFYERLPLVDETTFSNYPVAVFILLGFSLTLGVVININLRNVEEKNEAFGLLFQVRFDTVLATSIIVQISTNPNV